MMSSLPTDAEVGGRTTNEREGTWRSAVLPPRRTAAARAGDAAASRRPTRGRPITATTPAGVTARSTRSRRRTCTSSTLAWAFQTGQTDSIKATPILVNGIVYVTTPDNMWAVDARIGPPDLAVQLSEEQGFHIGHRGAAIYKDSVYLTTPDAHLVALDARTGRVRWNVEIADAKQGYWSTNAPLVVRNHLIVGVSGDFDNLPGMLKSFDPETGELQWTFYSTPPPGRPARRAAARPAGRCG